MFKSRVNQPTRIFVNSSDDATQTSNPGFNSFRILLETPILNAKRLQLLRATVPNVQLQIPDYMLTFWYYNLPTATTAPTAAFLKCVRLYPSYYTAPAGLANTKNRYFTDPGDFVTVLNTAAAVGGDNIAYNPFWVAGDLVFSYDSTTKQITFKGTSAGRYYAVAGWDDPNVALSMPSVLMPNYSGVGNTVQPYLIDYTLNLRVGYCFSGKSQPILTQGAGNPQYANLTNTAFLTGTTIPVDSFPNLVYTGSVYFYSDIVAGSSVCSNKAHNLLSVIPVNAPQLGVIQYVAATLTWLDKIPDTIYEVRIIMLDENNQPFNLPDSAVVNAEIGIGYE